MADLVNALRIQVAYAEPSRQILLELTVASGTTLHEAIMQSGILMQAPQIDLHTCRVGIFSKLKALDTVLRDRDRIEIYRSLIADPKDARRARATSRKK